VRDILAEFGFTAHIRSRGEEAQAIKREAGFRARRWVVERAHRSCQETTSRSWFSAACL
jgi:putative transposase